MQRTLQRMFNRQAAPRTNRPPVAGAPSWFEASRPRRDPVGLPRDFLHDSKQLLSLSDARKALLQDPDVLAAIERDDVPIPATEDREHYCDDRHLEYWLSGQLDLRQVESLVPRSALASVLDFGGASGRFARHLISAVPAAQVTIAELNLNHVLWCNEHFGKSLRALKVSQTPHFPLADRSVTCCVAFSVFTHIDAFETGWLSEIHRVLTDDGYALLTIHSEHSWPLLPGHPSLMAALRDDPRFGASFDSQQPMPAERLVFDYQPGTIYHCCNTFLHTRYIRRCWGRWFDSIDIHPLAHHGFQTAVLLRKHA